MAEEESEPATAEPAENAAEQAQPPHRRWRPHIPTSVLVTLLVAALSVWVAPAFTRQFEDRKQARELKASLAESIALASGAAVADGKMRIEGDVASGGDLKYERQWDVAALRIEVRLRAYTPALVEQWQVYTAMMQWFFVVNRAMAAKHNDPTRGLTWVRSTYNALAGHLSELDEWRYWRPEFATSSIHRINAMTAISRSLLAASGQLIDQLLATRPEGFSTTRRDLLRDLLP